MFFSARPALAAAIALVAIWLDGDSASAATIVTYQGTISDSMDQTGIFGGGAHSTLDGLTYSLVYTINDLPGALFQSAPGYSEVSGGPGGGILSTLSPASAIITINGISFSFAGDWYGRAYQTTLAETGRAQIVHHAQDYSVSEYIYSPRYNIYFLRYINNYAIQSIDSLVDIIVKNGDYHSELIYNTTPWDTNYGYLLISTYENYPGIYTVDTQARLTPSSVRISTAVPETATWWMMLVAFGAIGTRMRVRRFREQGARDFAGRSSGYEDGLSAPTSQHHRLKHDLAPSLSWQLPTDQAPPQSGA